MMRGEIWWVDFGVPLGSEAGHRRPALVVQSDIFNNSRLNTTIVVPLTTNLTLADFPGNALLRKEDTGLKHDGVAVTIQITAINKSQLLQKISCLPVAVMNNCAECLKVVLAL